MTGLPDFTQVSFANADGVPPAPTGEAWTTPEGIEVAQAYSAADTAGLDHIQSYPGIAPYLRGPYPAMYVTQPWTIRQYAGLQSPYARIARLCESESSLSELANWIVDCVVGPTVDTVESSKVQHIG